LIKKALKRYFYNNLGSKMGLRKAKPCARANKDAKKAQKTTNPAP